MPLPLPTVRYWTDQASRGLALAGAVLLLVMAGVTTISVLGRKLAASPVPGDYELMAIALAVAVFWFLPYGQSRRGHVRLEVATQGLPPGLRGGLDRLADLMVAGIAFLLMWRMAAGALDWAASGESSMILGLPRWWGVAAALPGLALWGLVALIQALGRPADPDVPPEREA